MQPKPWYQSKTLWLNVIGLGVVTAQALSGVYVIPDSVMMPALAVGNAWLRFLTSQPIGAPEEDKQ